MAIDSDETDAPLKLSEASRLCEASVSTLHMLASDDALGGVVRGRGGHIYLRRDAVPTWQQVVDLVHARLVHHIERPQKAHRRVVTEIEAVGLDLAEALEHPRQPLGEDLVSFQPRASMDSPLGAAMWRLESESWAVRKYNEALRELTGAL